MRPVLLIAWREYRQYIFSRGFLLFLILMPLGVIFLGAAVGFLEQSKPARRFAVVDLSGAHAAALSEEFVLRRKWDVLAAWDGWLALSVEREIRESGAIAYPFYAKTRSRARAEAFDAAGLGAAAAAAAPHLRKGAPPFKPPPIEFDEVAPPAEALAALSAEEAAEVMRPHLVGKGVNGSLFAAVIIPEDFGPANDAAPAQYWSRNLTDRALKQAISDALDHALRKRAADGMGLSAPAFEKVLDASAPVAEFRPDRSAEQAELGDRDRIEIALPAAMTYMLLVIVFGVGNLLLTNTIEERSNKIVEVLLSSVTANQLMWGKLLGIAAVGLTMPTIFMLTALVAATGLGGGEISGEAVATLFGSGLIFVYLFYFFCAYAIFAMIFLAIGSVSNTLQDAQSYMGPVMLLVMLPLPFMVMVYQNPNGLLASVLTWIPIYTPYAVMMRAASDPPPWEIAGATALMLAFAIVLTRAMGRIFRHAILQSSPAKVRDIVRLARQGR
jgi:ABC-2 type transport system permease protein